MRLSVRLCARRISPSLRRSRVSPSCGSIAASHEGSCNALVGAALMIGALRSSYGDPRGKRLHRDGRSAGAATDWPRVATGSIDRKLRRHALRRAAPSASDHRSSADRPDGQARRQHFDRPDQRRVPAPAHSLADHAERARVGGGGSAAQNDAGRKLNPSEAPDRGAIGPQGPNAI